MTLKISTSPQAFSHNMSVEVDALKAKGIPAGKAVKQAAAISYATKRKAAARKRGIKYKRKED